MIKSTRNIILFLIASFFSCCSENKNIVKGSIFVITEEKENIKIGDTKVAMLTNNEFTKLAKQTIEWIESEAKFQAQQRLDKEKLTSIISQLKEIKPFTEVGNSNLEELQSNISIELNIINKNLLASADIVNRTQDFINDRTQLATIFTTDAEGSFTAETTGKVWFISQYTLGSNSSQKYFSWFKKYETITKNSQSSLIFSNSTSINSIEHLFSFLCEEVGEKNRKLNSDQNVKISPKVEAIVNTYNTDKVIFSAIERKNKFENDLNEQRSKALSMTLMCNIPAGKVLVKSNSTTEGNTKNIEVEVSQFYLDKYEINQAIWDNIREWASLNGYKDLASGNATDLNHPVFSITWWDAIKWCNARSEKESLQPVYLKSDGTVLREGVSELTVNWSSNGYRLPTEVEWELAARGGNNSSYFSWGDTITHDNANYYSSQSQNIDVSSTRGFHPNTGKENSSKKNSTAVDTKHRPAFVDFEYKSKINNIIIEINDLNNQQNILDTDYKSKLNKISQFAAIAPRSQMEELQFLAINTKKTYTIRSHDINQKLIFMNLKKDLITLAIENYFEYYGDLLLKIDASASIEELKSLENELSATEQKAKLGNHQNIPVNTFPVDAFAENKYGLHNTSGNVMEWCWDYYDATPYLTETVNPRGPSSGSYRVVKGGSWFYSANYCVIGYRGYEDPSKANNNTGFRVARTTKNSE